MNNRPNIFFYMSDQEIVVPDFIKEHPGMAEYFDKIDGLKYLKKHSVEFTQHRTASLACTPARASLWSGRFAAYKCDPKEYPFTHRIINTYGLAKDFDDKDLRFFEDENLDELLTTGYIFQQNGYDTAYFGKDHVFRRDGQDNFETDNGELKEISSIHPDKTRNFEGERLYSMLDVLNKFGWTANKWKGPNPHGPDFLKLGETVDSIYSEQVKEFLNNRQQLIKTGHKLKPLLLIINWLQPHDESMYGLKKMYEDEEPLFQDENVDYKPDIGDWSLIDNVNDLAPIQEQFLDVWENNVVMPKEKYKEIYENKTEERQFYFKCYKEHYEHLHDMMKWVENSCFYRNTFQIKTTDHGTMLRTHHNFPQKWLTGWDLAVKIPLYIYHPAIQSNQCHHLTSSVDILPTMLQLAGIRQQFPLAGESLLNYIFIPSLIRREKVVYTSSYDNVLSGARTKMIWAIRRSMEGEEYHYKSMSGATALELVVGYIGDDLVKIIRFFDPEKQYIDHFFQLYNLSQDPNEVINLSTTNKDLLEKAKNMLKQHKKIVFLKNDQLNSKL